MYLLYVEEGVFLLNSFYGLLSKGNEHTAPKSSRYEYDVDGTIASGDRCTTASHLYHGRRPNCDTTHWAMMRNASLRPRTVWRKSKKQLLRLSKEAKGFVSIRTVLIHPQRKEKLNTYHLTQPYLFLPPSTVTHIIRATQMHQIRRYGWRH